MVLRVIVVSLLGNSIVKFLGLELGNYLGTWKVYFVGFLLVSLGGLIIGTWEGSLVGLLLVISLGSPLESPNHVAVLGSFFKLVLA